MWEYALPAGVALLALAGRMLDIKGAFYGVTLGYALLIRQNEYWLYLLLAFFVLGSAATKMKSGYKKKYGLFQKTRSTENVLANGGVATLMAVAGNFYGFLGALTTATADTLSSELGVLSKQQPRMVTNFRKVPTGTNGGVTALGTLVGLAGAAAMCGLAIYFNMFDGVALTAEKILIVGTVSGMVGCFVDSYVGALLENKGKIENWGTNLIATTSGGIVGALMGMYI
jgi:uncharacterized protein (TIGR00297 family)